MSYPQTNFENNNRMSELTKNINDIFGYILLYSVIIFTTISALFGGIVVYPIYGVIYIFNKIRSAAQNEIVAEENEIMTVKKPIIDENWCNISVKNIINFENEIEEVVSIRKPSEEELRKFQEEHDTNADEIEADDTNADEIEADDTSADEIEADDTSADEIEADDTSADEIEADDTSADEIEADDNSPRDKYSIGHYKSKNFIDHLDCDN